MTDITGERARLAAVGLAIERREQWGSSVGYTSDRTVTRPASYLFLHIAVIGAPARNVAAERSAMRTIESIGDSRFGVGASYNAAACQSGRLYELQPLTRRGAHTVNDKVNPALPAGSLNGLARALVLPQNVDDDVTDDQVEAAARWGAACRLSGEVRREARWYGHRDVTAKDCPGQRAYDRLPELRSLTDRYTADGLGGGLHMDADVAAAFEDIKRALRPSEATGFAGKTLGSLTRLEDRDGARPGYLAVDREWDSDDPVVRDEARAFGVHYVAADHQSKLHVETDGPVHTWLKNLTILGGGTATAERVDREVLDAVPTAAAEPPPAPDA